jgi:hypothetical protein
VRCLTAQPGPGARARQDDGGPESLSEKPRPNVKVPGTVLVTGSRYVELATTLLQRMRLADAADGVWEAADFPWWSRYERATDAHGQLFWLDAHDEPVAAVALTDWGDSLQCDVLVLSDPGGSRGADEDLGCTPAAGNSPSRSDRRPRPAGGAGLQPAEGQ